MNYLIVFFILLSTLFIQNSYIKKNNEQNQVLISKFSTLITCLNITGGNIQGCSSFVNSMNHKKIVKDVLSDKSLQIELENLDKPKEKQQKDIIKESKEKQEKKDNEII